mgnify:CR=1 FL=1
MGRVPLLVRFVCYGGISLAGVCFYASRIRKYSSVEGILTEEGRVRLRKYSAVLLPLLCVCSTLFSIDWVLAREPQMVTAAWPVYFLVTVALSGILLLSAPVMGKKSIGITPGFYKNVGNLALAMVLLKGYLLYSMVVVTWFSGEELRLLPGLPGVLMWGSLFLTLAVPVISLLFTAMKRAGRLKIILDCIGAGLFVELIVWGFIFAREHLPVPHSLWYPVFMAIVFLAGMVLSIRLWRGYYGKRI